MGTVKMGIYFGDPPARCSVNTDISLFCTKRKYWFHKVTVGSGQIYILLLFIG